MVLAAKARIRIDAKQTSPLDLGAADATIAREFALSLTDGALAGQANRLFSDTRTLAASATEDLDLNGTLVDGLGSTVTFARVKALIVAAAAANANEVLVGGAASNGFITPFGGAAHQLRIRPGGAIALLVGAADLTGYAVTAATGDQLRIGNGGAGTPVTYDIVIVGAGS